MQNKEKSINKIHFEDIKLYFINIQMWQGECLYLYIQKKINIYCTQTVFFPPSQKYYLMLLNQPKSIIYTNKTNLCGLNQVEIAL